MNGAPANWRSDRILMLLLLLLLLCLGMGEQIGLDTSGILGAGRLLGGVIRSVTCAAAVISMSMRKSDRLGDLS